MTDEQNKDPATAGQNQKEPLAENKAGLADSADAKKAVAKARRAQKRQERLAAVRKNAGRQLNKKITMKHVIVIVAAVVVAGILARQVISTVSRHRISVAVQTSLEKVLEINELHTVEYVYNSYAVAYNDSEFSMDIYGKYAGVADVAAACKASIDGKEYDFKSLQKTLVAFPDFYARYKEYVKSLEEEKKNNDSEKSGIVQGVKNLFAGKGDERNKIKDPVEDEVSLYKNLLALGEKDGALALFQDLYDYCNGDYSTFSRLTDFINRSEKSIQKDELYAIIYNGTVIAGIDESVTFERDDSNKVITVYIPEVKFIDFIVELPYYAENKSVIIRDKDSVREKDWVKGAFSLCEADLKAKAESEKDSILTLAKANARNAVEALIEPLKKNSDYDFIIVEGK